MSKKYSKRKAHEMLQQVAQLSTIIRDYDSKIHKFAREILGMPTNCTSTDFNVEKDDFGLYLEYRTRIPITKRDVGFRD